MAEQSKKDQQPSGNQTPVNKGNQAGAPGTTPGSAEGDEETIDESLRQKENKQQK